MNNILIFNPKCSKSREAVSIVEGKALGLEMRNYIESPLSKVELIDVISILGVTASDIIRIKETEFSENNLAEANEDQLIEAIVSFPTLLERPIAIIDGKGVVARPASKILDII